MYREMWESIKEVIEMALEEGRDCGYDNPKHEAYDKFWTWERISKELNAIETRVMRCCSGDSEIASDLIKSVIFNDPATVVIWYDGTKTVVKCQPVKRSLSDTRRVNRELRV